MRKDKIFIACGNVTTSMSFSDLGSLRKNEKLVDKLSRNVASEL